MKKILFSLLMSIATVFTLSAQTGLNGINYQAVARNANGTVLANQPIQVKISILGGAASGALQYQENHSLSTNLLGLFTLQIGKGAPVNGVFANVPWQSANQFLKVELAIGNGGFSDLGTTQLMSVPYALFAANSSPGSQGPAGAKGEKGDRGDVGLPGAQGIAGTKGDKGESGNAGLPGLTGAKGDKGDRGLPGIPGVAGAKGDKGDIGATGPMGLKGDQGLPGIPGAVGAAGATGAKGDIGATGPMGLKGDQGLPGIPGAVGAAGVKGDKGDPGDITSLAAGGDLAGTYPNPTVIALQTKAISNVAPAADQYLKFDGTQWLAAAIPTGAGLTLPYAGSSSADNVIPFKITNNSASQNAAGDFENSNVSNSEPALKGVNNSTENFGIGVQGLANANTISKTSAGVSGQLLGTGISGAGVLGYAQNATGVYGTTDKGIGVKGLSTEIGGYAGQFNGNGGSTALLTIGPLKFQNIGEAAGKVLTSDVAGNATWQAATAGLTLPYDGIERSITVPLFSITNTGGTPAIKGRSESDGIGVLAESKDGTALYAKSNEGNAAQFIIDNAANSRDVIDVGTNGTGSAIRAQSQSTQATILAQNDNEDGIAISGTSDFGVGVKGSTSNSTGIGVLASAAGQGDGLVAYSSLGRPASMRIDNPSNGHDVLTLSTAGTGVGINVTSNNNAAVRASNASNASAVEGSNAGTGAGVSGYSESGTAVYAYSPGGLGLQASTQSGKAAKIEITRNDNTNIVLDVSTAGTGTGVKSTTKQGTAIEGVNSSTASATYAVRGEMSATNGSASAGVRGENKNLGSNGYGVYGTHAGVGGTGIYGTVENGIGVFGESNSGGSGVYAISTDGIGLRAISQNGAAGTFASGSGLAIKTTRGNVEINGQVAINDASVLGGSSIQAQTTGTAIAGYFVNLSPATSAPAVSALTFGTGPALIATAFGAPGVSNVAVFKNNPFTSAIPATNVARIDNKGRGFFNDGTQTGGADIAEAFDITGNIAAYEPGDILVISVDKDRTVEKSGSAYSNLVAGVYATKPGVLLTEEHIDTDISNKAPMGVIGVIPTKVCLEGGAIRRGDMLVTSSQAGVAMKADLNKVKIGQVLGKALQDFNQDTVAKINVLVSIK